MQTQTETTTREQLGLSGEVAPICDRDCKDFATLAYVWEWGEKGVCCQLHAGLLQQIAGQISRGVQLLPLPTSPVAAPLTRDERTRLQATALVLNEELEEAKARGLELYRQTNELTRQVQSITVREREARAQLTDRDQKIAALQRAADERDAEHGELVSELERLRTLETLFNAPERHTVG